MSLSTGDKLGPYEILSPLGAGGMGEVYRAKDATLGREVAIKVLPADVASSPERLQRFEREAKTVATLNHPNIVTIFGIQESGGHRFIAMELVEGETLDRMIAPGGLPLAKIFDIAIPLADALAAAHDKGIVHRDLKPANVMVTKEGRVKVLDFGLAKLTAGGQGGSSQEDATMSAPLTGRGVVIGTVPYMSPEQLQGETIDNRSDLFSLGIMLYEMATGQRPFKGKNSATITSSILRDTPRPLHELNSILPRHLGRIIEHCLEKDPEHRTQSAKDVRNELRALRKEMDSGSDLTESQSVSAPPIASLPPSSPSSTSLSGSAMSAPAKRGELWIGVAVISTILIAGFWYMRPGNESSTSILPTKRGASSAIDSLAVLPFANESGDPDAEFLSDGIAESVINSLITVPNIRVVSRNTAFRHRGRESELDDVARDLNVRAILTGRVLKRRNRLVVSVSLEDLHSHEQLWGERFDREVTDILILEREISERIMEALRLTVNRAKRGKPGTENPEARLAYMRGRFFWNKRTLLGFNSSLEQYDRAIELDPGYALAYAGKATTYVIMGMYTYAPLEVIPLAKRAAEKAIELDPTLAEAYTPLAWLQGMYERNWPAAEQTYIKAIDLNPRYETVHHWYGVMLACLGRFDEAEIEFKKAQSIDPGSFVINRDYALPALMRRNFALAERRMRHTAELYPNNVTARLWSSSITLSERRFDESIAYCREMTVAAGSTYTSHGLLGYALGLAGRRSEALEVLNRLEETSTTQYVPAIYFALVHAGLGDLDHAFEYFDRALEEQVGFLALLKFDPTYDPLRHDPRFDRLLERIGFPTDLPAPVVEPWKR